MLRRHGFGPRKGEHQPPSEFAPTGKFGRMFPNLPAFTPSEEGLTQLGNAMNDTDPNNPKGDNINVPAGYTYLGQFIDHDITFDTTALGDMMVDPLAVKNFRTPKLDLDSLYGSGPDVQPYLYQIDDSDLFLIGKTNQRPGGGDSSIPTELPNDLPRSPSTLAIIGDPRNDENLIVAQTHLAFLKFHNKIVEGIRDGSIQADSIMGKSTFEAARELVVWHYQWIVLFDFLSRVIDQKQLIEVLEGGRRFFKFGQDPFMPVEFSVAAYRLGHSMIRADYDYNRVFTSRPGGVTPATLQLLFLFTAQSGQIVPIPSDWVIDWRRFFPIDPNVPVNLSRQLDPFLVDPLKNLPNVPPPNSLAVRNLLRGRNLGLPAGQDVARCMGFRPLSKEDISTGQDGNVAAQFGFDVKSPLWYYILKEAQIQGNGVRLGDVGSRILAEVFVGLIEGDRNSFLSRCSQWTPILPSEKPGTFTMTDLLRFVGDANPIGD
ncbi:peroxidase family protein [Moorena producens]|uniref:peroxidase family protein n=1 Tax=Moorena producens TaxID=1155739 RepID=UPI003C753B54